MIKKLELTDKQQDFINKIKNDYIINIYGIDVQTKKQYHKIFSLEKLYNLNQNYFDKFDGFIQFYFKDHITNNKNQYGCRIAKFNNFYLITLCKDGVFDLKFNDFNQLKLFIEIFINKCDLSKNNPKFIQY